MTLDPKHAEALEAIEAALKHEVSVNWAPTPITSLIAAARAAAERALTPKRYVLRELQGNACEGVYGFSIDRSTGGRSSMMTIYTDIPGGASAARAEAERLCAEWNAKEGRS